MESYDSGHFSTTNKMARMFEITGEEASDFILEKYTSGEYDVEDLIISVSECEAVFRVPYYRLSEDLKKIYEEHESKYL